jgi:hypothetical protein
MSTRHQKSFVLALFVAVAILFTLSSSASAAEAIHNLILIIPESLPAAGIDQSNAPALARLRRDGVTFANSHAGFPRLTPPDSLVDTSDLTPSSLIAAADAEDYTVGFMTDEGDVGAALQQLVDRTLPEAKRKNRPFLVVYQLKEPKGLDSSQIVKTERPAYKPSPRAANAALEAIEAALKTLDLYDNTNIVVAAEHVFARVQKISDTSRARVLLPRENTAGVLPPGFLAIDVLAALQADDEEHLQLFDPDAGNSLVIRRDGGHPKLGNAIIAEAYSPEHPYITVEAHGVYDSIFLGKPIPKADRRAVTQLILDMVLEQDYVGGVFVNEKRLGRFRGALPMSHIAQHGESGELPDIIVVFAPSRERCAPAESCTSVVADTPLVEGEGVANVFSRPGTATFMAARGPDFRSGLVSHAPASNADMNRTIATIMQLDAGSLDVPNPRVLREALAGRQGKGTSESRVRPLVSTPSIDGTVTELHLETLGETTYFNSAVKARQEALASDIDPPRRRWHWPFSTFTITISDDRF